MPNIMVTEPHRAEEKKKLCNESPTTESIIAYLLISFPFEKQFDLKNIVTHQKKETGIGPILFISLPWQYRQYMQYVPIMRFYDGTSRNTQHLQTSANY